MLCWAGTAEITDSLVDLLIEVVHKIRAHAENRVEAELVRDLKRVRGKQGMLFALAEAAVEHPDETVRTALFPVVSEATLRQLVKEAKASEQIFQQRVRKVIRGSYSNHYRRMLPRLLEALQFRCSNSAYRPVMEALELLGRHVDTPGQQRFYPLGERVSFDGVVPDEWRAAVVFAPLLPEPRVHNTSVRVGESGFANLTRVQRCRIAHGPGPEYCLLRRLRRRSGVGSGGASSGARAPQSSTGPCNGAACRSRPWMRACPQPSHTRPPRATSGRLG